MKTPGPVHRLGAPGAPGASGAPGAPLGNLAPLTSGGSRGDGRFARLLALDDAGPGPPPAERPRSRPARDKPEPDQQRPADGEAGPKALDESRPQHVEPQRACQADPAPAAEAPAAAEASAPRQDFATLAERMLRSVHVGQLPNGTKTLSLQVESGGKARIDVDLRLEAGKLRAQLGVAEASAYRALDGKLTALQGALSERGIVAHPVRLELRRERRETSKATRRGGERRGPRLPRRGGGQTVI